MCVRERAFSSYLAGMVPAPGAEAKNAFAYDAAVSGTSFEYWDQDIRVGEEPVAEFVASSFIDFLKLVAATPLRDDDPGFDPLVNARAA